MLPDKAGLTYTPSFVLGYFAPLGHTVDECYCLGGKEVNNLTEGMMSYLWHAKTDGTKIFIQPVQKIPSGEKVTTPAMELLTGTAISEVSLAFDQNMRPVVAYVEDSVAKMRYYDGTVNNYVVESYTGAVSPRVALDNYPEALSDSDIILSYIHNHALVTRTQRERYQIVRTIQNKIGDGWFLRHAGMSDFGTFQFALFRRECYETETGHHYPPPTI